MIENVKPLLRQDLGVNERVERADRNTMPARCDSYIHWNILKGLLSGVLAQSPTAFLKAVPNGFVRIP
jgi:hypothetical protein